jgi:hypothetical protein
LLSLPRKTAAERRNPERAPQFYAIPDALPGSLPTILEIGTLSGVPKSFAKVRCQLTRDGRLAAELRSEVPAHLPESRSLLAEPVDLGKKDLALVARERLSKVLEAHPDAVCIGNLPQALDEGVGHFTLLQRRITSGVAA